MKTQTKTKYGRRIQMEKSEGQEFKNLLADAEFNLVASRSAQAAVLKAVKAGETVVDLNNPSGDGTDPDGGGEGGGSNSSSGSNGGSTNGSGTGSGSGSQTPSGGNTSGTGGSTGGGSTDQESGDNTGGTLGNEDDYSVPLD